MSQYIKYYCDYYKDTDTIVGKDIEKAKSLLKLYIKERLHRLTEPIPRIAIEIENILVDEPKMTIENVSDIPNWYREAMCALDEFLQQKITLPYKLWASRVHFDASNDKITTYVFVLGIDAKEFDLPTVKCPAKNTLHCEIKEELLKHKGPISFICMILSKPSALFFMGGACNDLGEPDIFLPIGGNVDTSDKTWEYHMNQYDEWW